MNEKIRSFIAVELSPEIRSALKNIQHHLKMTPSDVRYVAPENIHLTLKFLGEITAQQVDSIRAFLKGLTRDEPATSVQLTKLGVFPHIRSPRIIWVGLDDKNNIIERWAHRLNEELEPLGITKEDRAFTTHVTIGRVRSLKNIHHLARGIETYPLSPGLTQNVSAITLFKSTLTPQGPIYEVIEEFPLMTYSEPGA